MLELERPGRIKAPYLPQHHELPFQMLMVFVTLARGFATCAILAVILAVKEKSFEEFMHNPR